MNLETERKIKYWLGLLLKVLFVIVALVKIFDLDVKALFLGDSPETGQERVQEDQSSQHGDTIVENRPQQTTMQDVPASPMVGEPKIIPKTVGIYIFNGQHLETQWTQQLGITYFQEYGIRAQSGYNRAQLLAGDLSSSVNAELVCVGSTRYTYYENSLGETSCEASLQFTTYIKATGELVSSLSRTISKTGPGSTRSKAKEQALRRIRNELAITSPTS